MKTPINSTIIITEKKEAIVCLTRTQIEQISNLLWSLSNQIEEILNDPIWEYDPDH